MLRIVIRNYMAITYWKFFLCFVVSSTLALSICAPVTASIQFFVNNPTGNSIDWTNSVTGLGGVINLNVNFNTHPTGTLQSNFYEASDGVTLVASSADNNTVQFGTGPNDGNAFSLPISPGEGPHTPSNFLRDGPGAPTTLTISFDEPVVGAGLFAIDYFNPFGNNPLSIRAFDGPNGTGNLLGSANSVAFNFQPDHLYFMGVSDTNSTIRSIQFVDVSTNTGDTIGLDDVRFARVPNIVNPVPEPFSFAIWSVLIGASGIGCYRRFLVA